ncbi:MAG TPA: DUF3368 domain-containing protein [Parafilimonas sp.]|nr:DUF3368 domain-containing protein [Parafilimonas sp.]
MITPEVADEFGEALPSWINIQPATKFNIKSLEKYRLGKGEITSLALALDLKDSIVILDDEKAKKIARQLQLTVTGSLGVIVKAKQENLVPSVKDILSRVKATNFYMPSYIEETILKLANE